LYTKILAFLEENGIKIAANNFKPKFRKAFQFLILNLFTRFNPVGEIFYTLTNWVLEKTAQRVRNNNFE